MKNIIIKIKIILFLSLTLHNNFGSTEKNCHTRKIIYGTILVSVGLGLGFFLYCYNQKQKKSYQNKMKEDLPVEKPTESTPIHRDNTHL